MEDSNTAKDELYFKRLAERRRRLWTASVIIPAIIGIVAYLLLSYYTGSPYLPLGLSPSSLNVIGPISLLFSAVALVMIYLETGFKREYAEDLEINNYESTNQKIKEQLSKAIFLNKHDFVTIKNELKNLDEKIDQTKSINKAITEEHKDELVAILRSNILQVSTEEVFADTLEKIKEEVSNSNQVKEAEDVFSKTFRRLEIEIVALGRRGNINLGLGILTTIVGLGILGYFVIGINSIPEDKMAFLAHFIPRLSLVILIEVFAYFFLTLYKSSLSEIKYFQNEMTNAEAKLVALKFSTMMSDEASTAHVIKALSNTERNSILEKGQTTAEIEKYRTDKNNTSIIADKLFGLFKGKETE